MKSEKVLVTLSLQLLSLCRGKYLLVEMEDVDSVEDGRGEDGSGQAETKEDESKSQENSNGDNVMMNKHLLDIINGDGPHIPPASVNR